uniref:Uncharacterized protein n=1 Tax=Ciona savignyi TaxID=51511 RepID=H2Y5U5_CIOSA
MKKLLEFYQSYQDQPSYTNWILLAGRAEILGKKYSSHTERLSLVPCSVVLQQPHRHHNNTGNIFECCKADGFCDFDVQSSISDLLFSFQGPQLRHCDVIDLDNTNDDVISFDPKSRNLARSLIEEIKSSGFVGTPMSTLESKNMDESNSTQDIQRCVRILKEKKMIFSVGYLEPRLVHQDSANPWLSTGLRFKGDRKVQRMQIESELSRV